MIQHVSCHASCRFSERKRIFGFSTDSRKWEKKYKFFSEMKMKVSRPHVFSNMKWIWSMILPDSARNSSMYLFHRKFFTPQTAYRTFARARISVQDLIRKESTICAKHVTNARGYDFDFLGPPWNVYCFQIAWFSCLSFRISSKARHDPFNKDPSLRLFRVVMRDGIVSACQK